MSSPAHIRHCIDLLRQSLMCNADTTFEIKDEIAGGVHGFGVQHRCKDWNHLISLVNGWQAKEAGERSLIESTIKIDGMTQGSNGMQR